MRPPARFKKIILMLCGCAALVTMRLRADDLSEKFVSPPASARPWVYWTWLNSNLTKEGITADLEAMQRVGIGGALILDVEQGTPPGPMKFFDPQWQVMFKHAVMEAKRLGLEINMNNGAGYYGSGGQWVKPEQGMQWIYQSEQHVKGGGHWQGTLVKPINRADYRDIVVLAVAEPSAVDNKSRYKIPDLTMKALQWKTWIAYKGGQSAALDATAPPEAVIPQEGVINISQLMDASGNLSWDVPSGEWTLLRIGHAYNGSMIGPTPKDQRGPETDKLSKAATIMHFETFVKHLNDVIGEDGKNTLVATHIDSWEGGGQNWTAGMREEFLQRRGYDPVTYLPILGGRVIGSLQMSERFLWDLRKTVSELMVQNYVAEFARLAHENKLRFTFESYTTTGNDLDAANFVDEPMAEFWTPTGQGADFYPTMKAMASAAHINGRSIVGAEAFTSFRTERWLWHPAMIKKIGDDAFAQGVNRFVFHRYASQPFMNRVPGQQMGPWGLHYERTNTWWEWTTPWHTYLARSQYMLRQGQSVADVLSLQSEEPILRFQAAPLIGYDYDACSTDTFQHIRVENGKLVLPNGRSYRLLTLRHTGTMTVPLLTRIRDLVLDGATIVGDPPLATPGLTNYPQADAELKTIADQLWGTDPTISSRTLGKGRIFRGISAEHALVQIGITADFKADKELHWTHRTAGQNDIYFVSNPTNDSIVADTTFRVTGKVPELWDAETGRIVTAFPHSSEAGGNVRLSLPFAPSGAWFVVFRPTTKNTAPFIQRIVRDGQPILEDGLLRGAAPVVDLVNAEVHEAGAFVIGTSDGKLRHINVSPLPKVLVVNGPWTLRFPSGWGAPSEVTLDKLKPWNSLSDAGAKYFSGTATYTKTLTIPAAFLNKGRHLTLDLGQVAVMAKVSLNGRNLGILWKPPFQLDITAAAKPGVNQLEIAVVNLWSNRLIGDEQLPEDSERNTNGTLKAWPQWLLDGKPSPTGRLTFSSWRLWKNDDALQDSGLLGPVVLRTAAVLPMMSK